MSIQIKDTQQYSLLVLLVSRYFAEPKLGIFLVLNVNLSANADLVRKNDLPKTRDHLGPYKTLLSTPLPGVEAPLDIK